MGQKQDEVLSIIETARRERQAQDNDTHTDAPSAEHDDKCINPLCRKHGTFRDEDSDLEGPMVGGMPTLLEIIAEALNPKTTKSLAEKLLDELMDQAKARVDNYKKVISLALMDVGKTIRILPMEDREEVLIMVANWATGMTERMIQEKLRLASGEKHPTDEDA